MSTATSRISMHQVLPERGRYLASKSGDFAVFGLEERSKIKEGLKM